MESSNFSPQSTEEEEEENGRQRFEDFIYRTGRRFGASTGIGASPFFFFDNSVGFVLLKTSTVDSPEVNLSK